MGIAITQVPRESSLRIRMDSLHHHPIIFVVLTYIRHSGIEFYSSDSVSVVVAVCYFK